MKRSERLRLEAERLQKRADAEERIAKKRKREVQRAKRDLGLRREQEAEEIQKNGGKRPGPGRPPGPEMVFVALRIPRVMHMELLAIAEEEDRTMVGLIRNAVRAWLDAREEEEKKRDAADDSEDIEELEDADEDEEDDE